MAAIEEVLGRLERVRSTARGWTACCPAHPDRTPSLSVAEGDIGVLVKCWAGCTVDEIADAMGLRVADLFYHPLSGNKRRRGRTATKRIDWRRQAAALEGEALTLWLHANEVFAFARSLDTTLDRCRLGCSDGRRLYGASKYGTCGGTGSRSVPVTGD